MGKIRERRVKTKGCGDDRSLVREALETLGFLRKINYSMATLDCLTAKKLPGLLRLGLDNGYGEEGFW